MYVIEKIPLPKEGRYANAKNRTVTEQITNAKPIKLLNFSVDFISELQRVFKYEKSTGKIYRIANYKNSTSNRLNPSKEIGYLNKVTDKTIYVRIVMPNRIFIYAHQIAFAIIKGYIPEEIDHKDGNGCNNKWDNLRESIHSQNMSNRGKNKNNTSGHKGVMWSKRRQRWIAVITHKGEVITRQFENKEDAIAEYTRLTVALNKQFAAVVKHGEYAELLN